jgi:HD-GYP domain-containing protein (c-di-GMP phosphodiesterase class II)
MAAIEQISTQDLVPGMYVAQLDRPWLETPFLFQGFFIKDQQEVEELRRYCRHVFVHAQQAPKAKERRNREVARAPRPPAEEAAPRSLLHRLFPLLQKRAVPAAPEPRPGEFYKDSVEVRVEVARAKDVYAQASSTVGEMMERIRQGGKLDVTVLDAVVSPMIESVLRNRDALTWLSRMKQTDDYTYGHSVSCAIYAIAFGRHLGLPREDLQALGLGGLLLDVGKTRLPPELLGKTEPLTQEELALVHSHVRHSEAIVSEQSDLDSRVLAMVRSHHERYDGSGYPQGLKGPDIPVFARIAGIVDFYDALITPRVYAPAVSSFDATRELNKRANTEFQAEMVEQFIQAVGVFPNGALVELSTGEVGVVIEQNRVRRLRPKITVILDRDKRPVATPSTIDLRDFPSEPGDESALWIDRGLETGAYGIDPADYYL